MFSQLLRAKATSAVVMAAALALPLGVAVAGLPSANVSATPTPTTNRVPSSVARDTVVELDWADVSDFDVPASVIDLEQAVVAHIESNGGVLLVDKTRCPADRLAVSYTDPGDGWVSGAHVAPLGPAPTETTSAVNGVVLCGDSHHAYVGFEAVLDNGTWVVGIVPDPAGGFADEVEEHRANTPDVAPKPKPVVAAGPIVGLVDGPDIEGYATYEGQSTCDPSAKPGTLALRNLLLARYPSTSSLGISRDCSVGAKSEHKEGRAFDWGANVSNATQKAAVDAFLADLFATDSHGHPHALARRMGVMYVIWNRQIWSAYSASSGWRPYTGSSPHTDHVHLSLSWAGARAQTSFWSGTVVPGLPDKPSASRGNGGSGSGSGSGSATRTRTRDTSVPTSTTWVRRSRSTTSTSVDPSAVTSTSVRRWRSTTTTTAPAASTSSSTTSPWRRPTTTTTVRPTTTTTARQPSTTTTARWSSWRSTTTTTSVRPSTTTTSTTVAVPTTIP